MLSPSTSSRTYIRKPARRARASEDRDLEPFREAFGAAVVVGIGLGQRNGADLAASSGGFSEASFEGRSGGVTGIDQHEPAPTDEVRTDRLAGNPARGRHDDPHDVESGFVDDDRPKWTRCKRRQVRDVADMFQLLERRARRQPQADPAVGHGVEGVPRPEPLERDDLVADDRGSGGVVGQRRGEKVRVEAARIPGRGDPARQRREQVGPKTEIQRRGKVPERRRPGDQLLPGSHQLSGWCRGIGQEDAALLPQLPDGGNVGGGGTVSGTRGQPRRRIGRVDAPTGEHVHPRGEGHRRGPMGKQHLRAARCLAQHDHGRRRDRGGRLGRHDGQKASWNAHSQRPRAYCQSRSGSRTNPRDR